MLGVADDRGHSDAKAGKDGSPVDVRKEALCDGLRGLVTDRRRRLELDLIVSHK